MDLDTSIKIIFDGLLKSRTKYLVNVGDFIMNYRINNHSIVLYLFHIDKDTPENSFTKIDTNRKYYLSCNSISVGEYNTFGISIDGKYYHLPEMKRIDFANALDTLENVIKEYEKSKISDIISAL